LKEHKTKSDKKMIGLARNMNTGLAGLAGLNGQMVSDAMNRAPQIGRHTLEGVKFELHDPTGFGRTTRYNLRGKMFDLHVYGSDGTKYAAIDTVQQDPRWMMGVEITEAEMRDVAKLFGMNNAADVGNLMTWYPVVQAVTGRPIHKVLIGGDVSIRIVPRMSVRIARNFPLENVMVDVRVGNKARFAVAETDAPKHVVPVIADMFGVSSAELMSFVHFPGVVSSKGVIKRAGKHTEDAGLMLNRWARSIVPKLLDSCGACGERLVNSAVRTDPNASVQVAVCGSCAKRERTEIAGYVFARAGSSRRLVRRPDTGRPDTGRPDTGRPDTGRPDTGRPDTGRPETVGAPLGGAVFSDVGLAVLLSLQRLASRGTATTLESLTHPLARNIASLHQFGKIVGPRIVLRPFARLALRINLRCLLQKCFEAFDCDERLAFDAECEKLRVRKITAAELHARLSALLAATKAMGAAKDLAPLGPPAV
jgi:hypothetical protein